MMVSIDGKIEGYFADAPLTGACGDYYEEVIPKLGDAHGTVISSSRMKKESISLFSTVMASATGMMHSPAECRSWKF